MENNFDALRLLRGKPCEIGGGITVRQPTLDEIEEYGERDYFALVRTLTATPADQKVAIWDALHIYWEQMDEFELFVSLFGAAQKQDCSIVFPGLDASSFQPVVNTKTQEIVLRNADGIVIDRAIHARLTGYLRAVHRFTKNVDTGYNDSTRDIMIEDDRDELMAAAKKPHGSLLMPLISAMTNCVEFKYGFFEAWNLPIGAFMDAVARVQKIKSVDYTMSGIYAGNVDVKRITKSQLDWMGDLK